MRFLVFQIFGVCFPLGILINEKKDSLSSSSFDKTIDFSIKNGFSFFPKKKIVKNESTSGFNKKQNSLIKIEKSSGKVQNYWKSLCVYLCFVPILYLFIFGGVFFLNKKELNSIFLSLSLLFIFIASKFFSFFSLITMQIRFPLCFCPVEKLSQKIFQIIIQDFLANFIMISGFFFIPLSLINLVFYFVLSFLVKDFCFILQRSWNSFFHILKLKKLENKTPSLLGMVFNGAVNLVFYIYITYTVLITIRSTLRKIGQALI